MVEKLNITIPTSLMEVTIGSAMAHQVSRRLVGPIHRIARVCSGSSRRQGVGTWV